ncbi:MAG: hypothetical protein RMH84_03390 [Sulfolobales archaeon]|nr:hypothetical protein [Sulfolobales archaeon]MCX8208196.1 hypothetical protein [Sulfolobales archaeon]MDW8010621.1 hypothetical protein [Sulfolobales archaeon]
MPEARRVLIAVLALLVIGGLVGSGLIEIPITEKVELPSALPGR